MRIPEPLEDAIAKSRLAIVARIEAAHLEESPLWRVLSLQVQPIRTLFGTTVTSAAMNCKYSEGRPHLRGAASVTPRLTGSGMEFSVKPADRVILLIAAQAPGASECEIVRIESLESELLIKQRRSRP